MPSGQEPLPVRSFECQLNGSIPTTVIVLWADTLSLSSKPSTVHVFVDDGLHEVHIRWDEAIVMDLGYLHEDFMAPAMRTKLATIELQERSGKVLWSTKVPVRKHKSKEALAKALARHKVT